MAERTVIEKTANGYAWKFVKAYVSPQNILEAFSEYLMSLCRPEWNKTKLKMRVFEDGITNKLVGIHEVNENDIVVIRLNGNNTELFINRQMEVTTMLILCGHGMNPPLYCQFENGLCYGFAPGRAVSLSELSDSAMSRRVTVTLAKLHSLPIPAMFSPKPTLYHFFTDYLEKIPREFSDPDKAKRFQEIFGSLEPLRAEVKEMTQELDKLNLPNVFCHNDLLSGNLIYNAQADSITLIDFEYGGPNPRAYDIADYFCEFVGLDPDNIDYSRYPDEAFQKEFLRMYLEEVAKLKGEGQGSVTDEAVHQLYRETNKLSLAAHLMWVLWALIQAEYSSIDFDYVRYSGTRFAEYMTRKPTFLAL